MNRRDFLKRAAAATAVAAGASGLGLTLHDPAAPPPLPELKALPGLGSFAPEDHPAGAARMAIVRGTDRAAMFEQGMRAMGGIERFIGKGDVVLVKVNAAFATPAALGATTSPELLLAVASACMKAGAARVTVTDNPINSPESCFEISGIAGAARQAGASLIIPRSGLFAAATLPGCRLIRDWPVLAGAFKGVTKLIALAPVKDHARAGASMLLKNMYGLLGGRRNVFHQDINGIVSELSLLARPTFSVLDGAVAMMTNGPTGGSIDDLKATGMLVVTTDPVAADAFGVGLLGRSVDDVPYIRMAQALGAGTADFESLSPVRLDSGA